jgi:exodeoxyribonuclease V alpha subunit
VVDESSIMNVILANKLIKAIPEGAHLLLVGDVDQLPSVGAGEVLRDLLAADAVPRVRLTQIFRQAQRSGIVVNAHRINHGQPPRLADFHDFYWFGCDPVEDSGLHPAEETAKLVVDIVARRIPAKFGLHPARDVQVLTPVHRGTRRSRQPQQPVARRAHPATRRDGRETLRRPGIPCRGTR